jgi:uncharacterized protein (TIGR03437 family)
MSRLSSISIAFVLVTPILAAQIYTASTIAGTNRLLDGGPATSAPLRSPIAVATDAAGNVYIADSEDNRVRKVSPQGTISTICGTGLPGFSGDRGKATAAALNGPASVAVDAAGNIFIADMGNYRVRRISTDGTINTVAGNGGGGFSGDGQAATQAQLQPVSVAVDNKGNLFIGDAANSRIRKVDSQGIITTIAGSSTPGFAGDNGPATSAQVSLVVSLAADGAGNLYFADFFNFRVREITAAGTMTTVAGSGGRGFIDDGLAATSEVMIPAGIALDSTNMRLYISDANRSVIRFVTLATGLIGTTAGNGTFGFSGDNGNAIVAELNQPSGLAMGAGNNLYICDIGNARVRKVAGAVISTFAGTAIGDGGPALNAFLNFPDGVTVDGTGHVIVADNSNGEVRRFTVGGTIASLGQILGLPMATAVDQAGNVYVSDNEPVVVKITPTGSTSVVAGNQVDGYSGDGQAATTAMISDPTGLAVDTSGNLYITDDNNARIRKVSSTGIISTIAGNGKFGYSGDGGPALSAGMDPIDVAVDGSSNLYVADFTNNRIRKVTPDGKITTVAGNGMPGYTGDGGPATAATLFLPSGVAVDATGNLYIADTGNSVVRRVTPGGLITTIAGSGVGIPASGDGGVATSAQMSPLHVALDAAGNIYVSDSLNDRIRMLTPKTVTAASLALVSGNNQSGAPGATLSSNLVVKISDSSKNPVPNVIVNFAVTPAGAAVVTPSPAITLADGTASVSVVLGNQTGAITVTASVSGLTSVAFSLTAKPAVSPTAPLISSGGVVSAGLSLPAVTAVSPNAIVSIFGQNFAPAGTSSQVGTGDLVNGKLPTTFAGVCVNFGSVPAPILAVFPTQLNVVVPQIPPGPTSIQVTNKCGTATQETSVAVTATAQAAAPEFFYFTHNADGTAPIAALDAVTGAYIGKSGLLAGVTFTPATPGEYLTLFATGFGATNPAVNPGDLPAGAAAVIAPVTVTIGTTTLTPSAILYAGVTSYAGLYQLNLQVPDGIASGNQPVVISIGGVPSPASAYITVQASQ